MLPVRPGLVVLVVILVALAGCGGPPDTASPAPTPDGTAVVEPETDATIRTTVPEGGTHPVTGTTVEETEQGPTSTPSDPAAPDRTETTRGEGPTAGNTLDVHFINVGQSSSTLLITPTGETVLIDSGDWRDEGSQVIDYLDRIGVDRLDHLVTTHADADHIGGHAAVIEHFETEGAGVGAVYDPGIASPSQTYGEYLDAVEAYEVPLYRTREGGELPVSGGDVSVLGPPRQPRESVDRNENSLVLRVTHGETSFLFTGDAEDDQEGYLVSNYGSELDSTVLQAGHHGSKSSTGPALLDAADPGVVVISSAYESQYGHPHEETLERLAERSIPTYWTAVHGDVVLSSDGGSITVSTQREATTVATDLRSEAPVEPDADYAVDVRETVAAGSGDGGSVSATTGTPTETATLTETATATLTATPTETETATPTTGDGELSLVTVHEDASGNDHENLNDEYLVFENTGDSTLDLSGWRLEDEAGHDYSVPSGFTLDPGERVTVYTGEGTDTETELYWGSGRAVWNNGGDTVVVVDDEGNVVIEEEYS